VKLIILILGTSAMAAAQERPGAFVGGSVSAANMESRTDIAYTGSFGYRFTRVVSFVIEATGVPKVRSTFPINTPAILGSTTSTSTSVVIFPGPSFSNPGGRIAILTNTARLDIPTTSTRLTPFFSAGGGIANIRRTADFTYYYPVPLLPTGVPALPIRPIVDRITSSSTAMALTLGGGVGVRVAKALWVDADLRLFRLLAEDDQNLGRFGVGVRYGF
jgi:hypothetical protein